MYNSILIRKSVFMLKIIGLYPYTESYFRKYIIRFTALFLGIIVFMAWFQAFTTQDPIDRLAANLEISTFSQFFGKVLILIFWQEKLRKIFKKLELFWENGSAGPTLGAELYQTTSTVSSICNVYMGMVSIAASSYYFKNGFNSLPFKWDWAQQLPRPIFRFLFCAQIMFTTIGLWAVLAFDMLFCSLITSICCQLRLIKHRLGLLGETCRDDRDSCDNFSDIVQHHSLILRFTKTVDEFTSFIMLLQLGTSILAMCFCLAFLSAYGTISEPLNLSKDITVLLALVVQVFLITFAGNQVSMEHQSVADAVFHSPFCTKGPLKLRKRAVLVIQRANKVERLTAGGMYMLNLWTFTGILRSVFSMFTLIRTMYNRNS